MNAFLEILIIISLFWALVGLFVAEVYIRWPRKLKQYFVLFGPIGLIYKLIKDLYNYF